MIAVGNHSFERFHCYFLEAYIHALKLYKWKEVLYIGFHVGFNVCHHYPYGRLIFYGAWYKGTASVRHGACHFIELVYKLVFLIKECIVLIFIIPCSSDNRLFEYTSCSVTTHKNPPPWSFLILVFRLYLHYSTWNVQKCGHSGSF